MSRHLFSMTCFVWLSNACGPSRVPADEKFAKELSEESIAPVARTVAPSSHTADSAARERESRDLAPANMPTTIATSRPLPADAVVTHWKPEKPIRLKLQPAPFTSDIEYLDIENAEVEIHLRAEKTGDEILLIKFEAGKAFLDGVVKRANFGLFFNFLDAFDLKFKDDAPFQVELQTGAPDIFPETLLRTAIDGDRALWDRFSRDTPVDVNQLSDAELVITQLAYRPRGPDAWPANRFCDDMLYEIRSLRQRQPDGTMIGIHYDELRSFIQKQQAEAAKRLEELKKDEAEMERLLKETRDAVRSKE